MGRRELALRFDTHVLEAIGGTIVEHSRAVSELAGLVASEMGVDEVAREQIIVAALYHDIGKLQLPAELLEKPAALTAEEFEQVKAHPELAQRMLLRSGDRLTAVAEIVRSCHERWDGWGYPDGLAGEDIPLAARIVFCCDAYDAMTSDRPYRRAMSSQEAAGELLEHAGTQFDPDTVATLLRVLARSAEGGTRFQPRHERRAHPRSRRSRDHSAAVRTY